MARRAAAPAPTSSSPARPRVGPGIVIAAVALVVVVLGAVVWLAGATWEAVPNDKIGIHYTGGPLEGSHFVEEVKPGTHAKFYGEFEHIYKLPATQRNYIVSRDANIGERGVADQLVAVSKAPNSVTVTFEAATFFKVNTKPEVIRDFFNQICLHHHCWDLSKGGGWEQMLDQFFRPVLENAVRLEAGLFTKDEIRSDPAVLQKMQAEIGASLKEEIAKVIGGEYFCGPDSGASVCTDFSFVLKDPKLPDDVEQAYARTAAATQDAVTAQQQALATVTRAKADADAQAARAAAPPVPAANTDYIRAQAEQACAQNDHCTLIISSGSTGVNVNAGKP
jgi:regulator of protease activity HflC (stomatin/prohibitin superfamily)